jgi:hypothetical protein
MAQDSALANMVNKYYGGAENLKQEILADFFKHGFDGSGDDGEPSYLTP